MSTLYVSHECRVRRASGLFRIVGPAGRVVLLDRRPDPPHAGRIGLELNALQRHDLGLPACGANGSGTMLCLLREDLADEDEVPRAPTNRDELVEAEVWPMVDAFRELGVVAVAIVEHDDRGGS